MSYLVEHFADFLQAAISFQIMLYALFTILVATVLGALIAGEKPKPAPKERGLQSHIFNKR